LGRRFYEAFRRQNVRFAVIGVRDFKLIKGIHNFITFKELFMKKPFKRVATSILFKDIYSKYRDWLYFNQEFFGNIFPSLISDYEKIGKYVQENYESIPQDIQDAILEQAYETDSFDKSLWDSYTRLKENLDKFEFIMMIETPSMNDKEGIRKYKSLVAQIMMFRKMKYGEFKEYEIVGKKPVSFWRPKVSKSNRVINHNHVEIEPNTVWKSINSLIETFPNAEPIPFYDGEIENPVFYEDTIVNN